MTSLILQTASRFLLPLLLVFSLFLLARGHNEPGGGFSGGLVAAAAFTLYMFGSDVAAARAALRVNPRLLIAAGLAVAIGAGIPGLLMGNEFLTGEWVNLHLPLAGQLKLGTPLLFDTGVYLVVVGVTLTVVFSLAEE
jgi:multicomponent Na+:H+ antiporter subunit B